jgi:uncharacterized protein (TIGR03437 family)
MLAGSANAQFVQQGGKLVGTGTGAGYPFQGAWVALSTDGNTALVGGLYDNDYVGATWVYTRSAGVWTQQGGKLVGTGRAGNSEQGSVALSSDGNTALVGGYYDNLGAGAAWVFTRSGGVWTQQGGKLVGTGAVGSAFQAWSVALSADGNTAIVGGPDDNSQVGAAWVFTRSGGVWTQQGGKLVGTGVAGSEGVKQGRSVALSADGNTALVGGFLDNNDVGAVWVFTRSGGVWTQQGGKLVGTGAVGVTSQGYAVALSADGNTALVGGPLDNNYAGAAWVFTRSGGVWTQQGGKLAGTGAVGTAVQQGFSVALSADGNTALVGGYGDSNDAGATWVFTRSGGVWTQQGGKLLGTGAVGAAWQGSSVALSGDGGTALVGAPCDSGSCTGGTYDSVGAAWVFVNVTPPAGPQFTNNGIVNAASFQPGPNGGAIAPGEIITIFGTGIGPSQPTNGYDAANNVMDTSVAGTQVLFDGAAAPIIYASAGQTTVVAPYSLAGKSSTQVIVSYQDVRSAAVTVPVVSFAPGIFTSSVTGSGQAAAENHDYSLNSPSNPEQRGKFVQVFMTVGGESGVDGAMAATAVFDNPLPTATIGGENAQVIYAGPSPGSVWGLTQVDVYIPSDLPLGGTVPLTITYGGVTSQANVTIAVKE